MQQLLSHATSEQSAKKNKPQPSIWNIGAEGGEGGDWWLAVFVIVRVVCYFFPLLTQSVFPLVEALVVCSENQ